jgi:hypothetical protein
VAGLNRRASYRARRYSGESDRRLVVLMIRSFSKRVDTRLLTIVIRERKLKLFAHSRGSVVWFVVLETARVEWCLTHLEG